MKYKFTEIKHFHPNGEPVPNGSFYQSGWYFDACRKNCNSFNKTILDEDIHPEQYGLANYAGGMIVFSTDVNSVEFDKNKLLNKLKQFYTTQKQRLFKKTMVDKVVERDNQEQKTDETIVPYSIGKSFNGRYKSDDGNVFDEKSTTVEVYGISSKALLNLSEIIAQDFMQQTVLIKDFNNGKIYLGA